MSGPYALSVDLYIARGWREVLPLPPGAKTPPPAGFTGAKHTAVIPTFEDINRWRSQQGDGNVALRMPPNVIGIDVDAYNGKAGAQSFQTACEAWGDLPVTWSVTSREDGISGIRFFRVPEGLAWPSIVGPGIEMIHRGHRYAVTWPSVHPETQARYEWRVQGRPVEPPSVGELPFLPDTWIEGLTGGEVAVVAAPAGASTSQLARALDDWETDGSPCRQVLSKVAEVDTALNGLAGSRHDQVRDRLLKVIRLGQVGHAGVGWAMDHIGELFVDVIGRERGHGVAEHEWQMILRGGVDIILGDLRPAERCFGDRCEFATIPSLDLPVVTAPVVDLAGQAVEASDHPLYADLTWVLTGNIPQPAKPVVLQFQGLERGLFYRGKVNGLFGEPETAKTWLALAAIVEELEAGGRALFLDADHNGSIDLAQRLIGLGADPAVLADPARFRLAEPESAQDCQVLVEDMKAWLPTIAVIDSLGEVIPMLGAASKDNDDITRVLRYLVKPLAHRTNNQCAVITIDHVAKADDNSGYAIGGTAKKRAMDGAYLKLKLAGRDKVPAPVSANGTINVFIEKDRQGQLRRHAVKGQAGVFRLDSSDFMAENVTRGSIKVWIQEPTIGAAAAAGSPAIGETRNLVDMERVIKQFAKFHAESAGRPFRSEREMLAYVGGNKTVTLATVDALVAAGSVSESVGSRGSRQLGYLMDFSSLKAHADVAAASFNQVVNGPLSPLSPTESTSQDSVETQSRTQTGGATESESESSPRPIGAGLRTQSDSATESQPGLKRQPTRKKGV